MPKNCEGCGACCRQMLFPIGPDHLEMHRWVRLHGLEVTEIEGQPYVRLLIRCQMLDGDRCHDYEDRPELCRKADCQKEYL